MNDGVRQMKIRNIHQYDFVDFFNGIAEGSELDKKISEIAEPIEKAFQASKLTIGSFNRGKGYWVAAYLIACGLDVVEADEWKQ